MSKQMSLPVVSGHAQRTSRKASRSECDATMESLTHSIPIHTLGFPNLILTVGLREGRNHLRFMALLGTGDMAEHIHKHQNRG
jgi:hypothetical protein